MGWINLSSLKKHGKCYTTGTLEFLWNRDLSLHVFPSLSFSLPKKGTVDQLSPWEMKMQKPLKASASACPLDLFIVMLLYHSVAPGTAAFFLPKYSLPLLSEVLMVLLFLLHLLCWYVPCQPLVVQPSWGIVLGLFSSFFNCFSWVILPASGANYHQADYFLRLSLSSRPMYPAPAGSAPLLICKPPLAQHF